MSEAKTIRCPNCDTEFLEDEAPWLQQKVHCAMHDRLRLAGTECEFCVAEAEEAGTVAETEEVESAVTDSKRWRKPMPRKKGK